MKFSTRGKKTGTIRAQTIILTTETKFNCEKITLKFERRESQITVRKFCFEFRVNDNVLYKMKELIELRILNSEGRNVI